jgi:hypothetical protein
VLPARGCGARKCIKTSGPLDGLNIHQHLGGQLKQIHTPDLYVRLRHGGALELSVCREDKIQILRAVILSLDLDPVAKFRAQKMISLIEGASKEGGVWGNVSRLVKSPNCHVCGLETSFGGKGNFSLCEPHNNWRTYIKLRWGK